LEAEAVRRIVANRKAIPLLGLQGRLGDQQVVPEVHEDEHWMWVARGLSEAFG